MNGPAPSYDYDAIAAIADALRPGFKGRSVVGIALPSGVGQDVMGSAVTNDGNWRPFDGAALWDDHIALRLPGSSECIHKERIFAIRVLKRLGGESLVIADRCVALRSRFPVGSMVAIADHLNMTGTNPLAGPNDARIGARFPDMAAPYDVKWIRKVEQIGTEEGLPIQRCVYAGVSAPITVAECRLLAYAGADVYGFGVIPDTIAAVHAGLRVVAVARVTASRIPDGPTVPETETDSTLPISDDMLRILGRLFRSG